ncbi:MAG: glycosyltransferase family 39 protein [Cyanosarcina radialis HA8281-LM2]|jgi:4-amino-4-deoxy-L-arabinose transferase-like glycosyltransferase|nr:glycosyltransferase family 39 protein [Cyanosarcina radialis HA8281-LM2]
MKLDIDRWEKQPKLLWGLTILWLLLIGWIVYLWNLGSIGLIDETEPLFAEASRQITVTGDWITPYFNGATRFDKPILIYWCQAIAFLIFGINEWAVRLPSALSAIALMGLTFYTLRRFGISSPRLDRPSANSALRERQLWLSAALSATIVGLNPLTLAWGRTGVSDLLLTACFGGALLSFFIGYATPKPASKTRWYLAFYILMALAILTKGPVGVVLPGAIVVAFLLYLGNLKPVLAEMRLILGGLTMLAIVLPWYVLVTWRNGESFINSFFGYHNLERFTEVVNHHDGPWYVYFLVVLVGFAPWCVYLPQAIARTRFWQLKKWREQPRSSHLLLFALFWLAIVFVFFSIAVTKRANYILPLIPAAAILVGLMWSEWGEGEREQGSRGAGEQGKQGEQRKKGKYGRIVSGIVNVLFLAAIAAGIFLAPKLIGYDPAVPELIPALERSGLTVTGGVIWAATAIAATILLLIRRYSWLWSVNLIGFLAFVILVMMPASVLVDRVRQLPLRELSAIVTQVRQPGEELMMIGFEKPSIVFYTEQPVKFFKQNSEAIDYLQTASKSWLILSQEKRLGKIKWQPYQFQSLGRSGVYQLIRVFKQA